MAGVVPRSHYAREAALLIWQPFHQAGLVSHSFDQWEIEDALDYVAVQEEWGEPLPADDIIDVLVLWLHHFEEVDPMIAREIVLAYLHGLARVYSEAGLWPR